MTTSFNDDLTLHCGDIVLHDPPAPHPSCGAGTLISQCGPVRWQVKFFDGREIEMIEWCLKKITSPLTTVSYSCRMKV
jgi:hypothetical protein